MNLANYKFRPLIYVSGKYRDPIPNQVHHNIQEARKYAELIWKLGGYALCPHLNSAYMGGICPSNQFLSGDFKMILGCDLVFLMPNWEDSEGARLERQFAIDNKICIIESSRDLNVETAAEGLAIYIRGFREGGNSYAKNALRRALDLFTEQTT